MYVKKIRKENYTKHGINDRVLYSNLTNKNLRDFAL